VPCLVLNPFGGSGTTGAVAEQMGRDSIMIDLKPEYVAMAIQRLGEITHESG
jgi:DNA modification methylase